MSLVLLAVGVVRAQKFGIKNNLLFDGAMVPNLGAEVGLGKKTTLDGNFSINPFTHNHVNRKYKIWIAQPELRFWSCERFNGFFWGIHAHGGEFNFGRVYNPFIVNPSNSKEEQMNHRYEGYFYGAGLSLGYQWVLSKRWNFELSLGVGWAHLVFDKFDCAQCGNKIKSSEADFVGPTKATMSFIYMIK